MKYRIFLFSWTLVVTASCSLHAAFNYAGIGNTYTQNFDSLAASGDEIEWTNDSTIVGWHLFRVTAANNPAPVPMGFYDTSNGSARCCPTTVLLAT